MKASWKIINAALQGIIFSPLHLHRPARPDEIDIPHLQGGKQRDSERAFLF
jgi:hypothetical protein